MARIGFVTAWLWMALFVSLALTAPAVAQDETTERPAAGTLDQAAQPAAESAQDTTPDTTPDTMAPDVAAANAACDAKLKEWNALIMHLRQLRTDYQTADPAERQAMAEQWTETIAKGEAMLPDLIDAVLTAYQAAPNQDRVKTNFLAKVLADYVARDEYEPALKIGQILVQNNCDLPDVFRDTGIAAFALNEYDLTTSLLDTAAKLDALGGDAFVLRQQLEVCKKNWEEEQQLLAKEEEADDLPRVKLTTTKGDIVVELFENEAPETVANFISLVKKAHYDSLTFHRVIPGFMAQGGCPVGDGTGGPGYTIYDECAKPGFRKHFRGVLSMAKTFAPNSAGSQFFIAFRPLPHLDGKHTVFGRVIEGMDVVNRLQRRDPETENPPEPDRILKAEVIRDRGHEYRPHIVE